MDDFFEVAVAGRAYRGNVAYDDDGNFLAFRFQVRRARWRWLVWLCGCWVVGVRSVALVSDRHVET